MNLVIGKRAKSSSLRRAAGHGSPIPIWWLTSRNFSKGPIPRRLKCRSRRTNRPLHHEQADRAHPRRGTSSTASRSRAAAAFKSWPPATLIDALRESARVQSATHPSVAHRAVRHGESVNQTSGVSPSLT